MSKQWTTERVNKLLHLVIQKHVTGTPDYNYLAAELGCTYDAVRQKWGAIRRELNTTSGNGGNPTPPATPQKRKPKGTLAAKADGGKDHLDDVKVEEASSENMMTVTDFSTPPSESPNKRKAIAKQIKSEVKVEDSDSDGQEYAEERVPVKKVRTARGAAMKAADKIKRDYEMPWETIE
jgi:hypothetical protein